jgi:hypothetical protein
VKNVVFLSLSAAQRREVHQEVLWLASARRQVQRPFSLERDNTVGWFPIPPKTIQIWKSISNGLETFSTSVPSGFLIGYDEAVPLPERPILAIFGLFTELFTTIAYCTHQ